MNAYRRSPQEVSDHLHPRIYMAVAGLLIWFLIAAWSLFGGSGYIELALAMISALVVMTILIPLALWRANVKTQRSSISSTEQKSETLDTWLQGRFATWTDQEKGLTAAIEILLPLAAVAFGITALGIVFDMTRAGVI
jgi:ABC-type transport system involved in cytochrome bd biosynthesis fused ATPase/permease subunit